MYFLCNNWNIHMLYGINFKFMNYRKKTFLYSTVRRGKRKPNIVCQSRFRHLEFLASLHTHNLWNP